MTRALLEVHMEPLASPAEAIAVESPRGPTQLSPAQEVKVEVRHLRPGVSPCVEHQAVATVQNAFALGHRPRCHQHLSQKFPVLGADFGGISDVLPGDDKDVNRANGPQVVERVRLLTRVGLPRGQLPRDHAAENTARLPTGAQRATSSPQSLLAFALRIPEVDGFSPPGAVTGRLARRRFAVVLLASA
jgi:hypothetical protein